MKPLKALLFAVCAVLALCAASCGMTGDQPFYVDTPIGSYEDGVVTIPPIQLGDEPEVPAKSY